MATASARLAGGWSVQATSVYVLGLSEPELPERDGSILCLRSVTFLTQMRAEGEEHLPAAPLEKAFKQLISSSFALAREGNRELCTLLPRGHPRQWC